MQIYPAIDLRGGRVVRLYQGDYARETIYEKDPCVYAREFIDAGAQFLHVVDLDGARDGTPANFETIAALTRQGGLSIEVGGGIRTEERIQEYLDLGVSRCILGTIAVKDFAFTTRMAQTYGGRIAVGVDLRGGYVAVSGWTEVSDQRGTDFCLRLRDSGVRTSAPLRDWRSAPPAASVPLRSCGSWIVWASRQPFWARPCTTASWI